MIFLLLTFWTSVLSTDSLTLGALYRDAFDNDPRVDQLALHATMADLQSRNLSARHLPQFSISGQAAYQSEVASFPGGLPGMSFPEIRKDQVHGAAVADQLLYDGGAIPAQRRLQEAGLAVETQAVRVSLYALREQVDAAFFAVLLADARNESLDRLRENLSARLALVEARVRSGAALPGAADAIRAELLSVDQQKAALKSGRRAALDVLSELTGRHLTDGAALVLPGLEAGLMDVPPARPEYDLFQRSRERLQAQEALVQSRLRPQVALFAQGGYGRPGFDFFNNDLHLFWQGGLRLRWALWDWGQVAREREVLTIQQRLIDTQRAAFERSQRLALQQALNEVERLDEVLRLDEELVALRVSLAEQAARQLENGILTPADYVDHENAAHQARIALETHRIERIRALVTYRTASGIELP